MVTRVDIAKATVRKTLPARREPYWRRIGKGDYLGFYKGAVSDSWIARHRDAQGKQQYRALTEATTFDEADAAAREWFQSCGRGIVRAKSVEQACKVYVARIAVEKGEEQAQRAEGFLRRTVYEQPLGALELDRLRVADIEGWRDGLLTQGLSKASANRTLRQLRAALNAAFRSELVASDHAWRAVRPYPNAENARLEILSVAQRRKLVRSAQGPIKDLVQAAIFFGARPIELIRLQVRDVDVAQCTLTLRGFKGRNAIERRRQLPITAAAAPLLKRAIRGKAPADLVFPRNDAGQSWGSGYRLPFRQAAQAAGLSGVSMYTLRHSTLCQWLASGIDTQTVSRIAGCGIGMLSSFYGKFLREHAHERIAAVTVL